MNKITAHIIIFLIHLSTMITITHSKSAIWKLNCLDWFLFSLQLQHFEIGSLHVNQNLKSHHHLRDGYATCKHAKHMFSCVCFIQISRQMWLWIAKRSALLTPERTAVVLDRILPSFAYESELGLRHDRLCVTHFNCLNTSLARSQILHTSLHYFTPKYFDFLLEKAQLIIVIGVKY